MPSSESHVLSSCGHDSAPSGIVYWFTGLSGSGKSTLASGFAWQLRARTRAVVYLDGDELREIFGQDLGYDESARRKSAARNGRLCKTLAQQGVDVVCATISLFHECRDWNRANIARYCEIFVRAEMQTLYDRDSKGLYRRARAGELQDVVGVDLTPELPLSPDLVVDNDGAQTPDEVVLDIMRSLGWP